MKVLVCGSRNWDNEVAVEQTLGMLPRGTRVMHGGARGADRMAGIIAQRLGFTVSEFPANWRNGDGVYNKHAGIERNLTMLDLKPDIVIAFHRDGSKGTQHVIDEAIRREIRLWVISA